MNLYGVCLDPFTGSCRRESDELTCQGIVSDKKQWNNQNYRETGEWAAHGLLGLKKEEFKEKGTNMPSV